MSFGVENVEHIGPGQEMLRLRLLKYVLASRSVLRKMSYAVPWNRLVPERVVKLLMPPVVRLNCAGGVAVVTLNSCSASTDGAVSSNVEPLSGRAAEVPSSITSSPKF